MAPDLIGDIELRHPRNARLAATPTGRTVTGSDLTATDQRAETGAESVGRR